MTNRYGLLTVALAAALTLLNAAKPAVVDDAAYLLLAEHVAAHPLDPYGCELFWYSRPQPAMHVLAPPVVPYWLAAGFALFGDNLFLLKLWLLPFAWLLCAAMGSLLRRFTEGYERPGLVLFALSPGVLPLFNFMLDVPALALSLAAVAVFARGCDRASWALAAAAGALAGLAMQTKYTAFTVPAVIGWYALLYRRWLSGIVAAVVAVGVFGGWEFLLTARYDQSHFLFHVRDQADDAGALARLVKKADLIRPLLGYSGWLGLGWGVAAAVGLGFGRAAAAVAVVAALGIAAVCLTPGEAAVLLRDAANPQKVRLDLPGVVFLSLGAFAAGAVASAAVVLCARRRDAAAWFLAGWLVLELGGYFALTPFSAGRRLMPLGAVSALIACRLLARVDRRPRWLVPFGVSLGVGLFAVDVWDALPERELARQAVAFARDRGAGRLWTQGHWGWQWYTHREGAELVAPGVSELKAGDRLIVPVLPDADGFYRPYHGDATFSLPPDSVTWEGEFVWDDALSAATVPTLYGGWVPVVGRRHPRLRVAVYRVERRWIPE